MDELAIWWQAYLAAMTTWVQHATADKADKYAAESADLALDRYRRKWQVHSLGPSDT